MPGFELNDIQESFAKAAKEWLCDSYHIEFRYVAEASQGGKKILHAMVLFYPWMKVGQDPTQFDFQIEAGGLVIGQKILSSVVVIEANKALDNALNGRIDLINFKLDLSAPMGSLHYVRGTTRDPWTNMIYMTISGLGAEESAPSRTLDDDLRRAEVPFDGFADVLKWLNLDDFKHPGDRPSIVVIVHPPARIAVQESRLLGEKLEVVIEVMPSIDTGTVSVAVMGSPPLGISLRKQVGPQLLSRKKVSEHIRRRSGR